MTKEERLQELREVITSQDVKTMATGTELFMGADIIISDDPGCPSSNGWSDYTKVVTPYAKELSWLIFQLKDIFADELDYQNKYWFYGTLAETANSYLESGKDDMGGLLLSVIDKASEIKF